MFLSKLRKKYWIIYIFFFLLGATVYSDNKQPVVLKGTGDTKCSSSKVRMTLKQEGPSEKFGTRSYHLSRLGDVVTKDILFHVVIYTRVWGSSLRMTKRLVLLSEDCHYLGMYDIPEIPNQIEGNTIKFPLEEAWGNKIVFHGKTPPEDVYLDGHLFKFAKDH